MSEIKLLTLSSSHPVQCSMVQSVDNVNTIGSDFLICLLSAVPTAQALLFLVCASTYLPERPELHTHYELETTINLLSQKLAISGIDTSSLDPSIKKLTLMLSYK